MPLSEKSGSDEEGTALTGQEMEELLATKM